MPRISVLVPTHQHASTLPYAVRSVQAQGVDDLEILICGDGVSDDLRAVISNLQRADARIRFFDLPKSPGIGEFNRDHVLREAKGRIVCHHNDDDLWLPGHIEVLERALEDADFVGAMQVNVDTDGKMRGYYFDLERPEFVEPWLNWKPNNFGSWASNGFGPIFVAHRLDAYLRLPQGWATTPAGLPADQVMWIKFLRQPWCRAKFLRWPIALHFPSSDRQSWTPEQRAEELRHWTEIIESQDYAVRIWRDLMPDLGDRLLSHSLTLNGKPQLRGFENWKLSLTLNGKPQLRGFENWKLSLTLNGKPQLRGFENWKLNLTLNGKPQLRGFENWKIRLTRSRKLHRYRSLSFRQGPVLRDPRRSTEFASWK